MDFLWDGMVEAVRRVGTFDLDTYHAVWVSLLCTIVSISLAALVAVPYGAWLAVYKPRGHKAQVFVLRVGMALPTVVIGLLIYGLLSRRGLFGGLDLLYTKVAIIAGEFILAFPLLGTLAHGAT
ncbi:MAG: ABC transporter permease, partial [Planctomycetota bacterium]